MLMQDKIFTTVSSTTFVHMRRYNQHKIKVSWRGFNGCRFKIRAEKQGESLFVKCLLPCLSPSQVSSLPSPLTSQVEGTKSKKGMEDVQTHSNLNPLFP